MTDTSIMHAQFETHCWKCGKRLGDDFVQVSKCRYHKECWPYLARADDESPTRQYERRDPREERAPLLNFTVTLSDQDAQSLWAAMAKYLDAAAKEAEMKTLEKLHRLVTYQWAYLSAEIKPEKDSPVEKAFFRILGEIEDMMKDGATPERPKD